MAQIIYGNQNVEKIKNIIMECGIAEFYDDYFKDVEKKKPGIGTIFASIGAQAYEVRRFLDQLADEDSDMEEEDDLDIKIKVPKTEEVIDKYMNYFAVRLNTLYSYIKKDDFSFTLPEVDQDNEEDITAQAVANAVSKLIIIIAHDYDLYNILERKITDLDLQYEETDYLSGLINVVLHVFIGKILSQDKESDLLNLGTIQDIVRKHYLFNTIIADIKKLDKDEIKYAIENLDSYDPFATK